MDEGRATGKINWDVQHDFDARQSREVFARYGLASYQAQCLEKQLAILLATTYNPDFLRKTPDEREVFFSAEFSKTLGRLLGALSSRVSIPPGLEAELREALRVRNRLAHDYFWECATDLLSREGRERMIEELQAAADLLGRLDEHLTRVSERWLEATGVSRETLEKSTSSFGL